MTSFHTNLIISCFIRGIRSFLYMVLDNRLVGIRSNWEPTIRIVKIAIRFSTNLYDYLKGNPSIITHGFKHVGISGRLAS